MNLWKNDWERLSGRINGFTNSLQFYLTMIRANPSLNIFKKSFIPKGKALISEICRFNQKFSNSLPTLAKQCLEIFLEEESKEFLRSIDLFTSDKGSNFFPNKNEWALPWFSIFPQFSPELEYYLKDPETPQLKLVERAFAHLKRILVTDKDIQERWVKTFNGELQKAHSKKGASEPSVEKLGGVHLLWHGIYTFKAHTPDARTDLVLGVKLNIDDVQKGAEVLALTEWKLVRSLEEFETKAEEAKEQAAIYTGEILAGIELASYRYCVLVSMEDLPTKNDICDEKRNVIYRFVNICIRPKSPSLRAAKYKQRKNRTNTLPSAD